MTGEAAYLITPFLDELSTDASSVALKSTESVLYRSIWLLPAGRPSLPISFPARVLLLVNHVQRRSVTQVSMQMNAYMCTSLSKPTEVHCPYRMMSTII